MTGEIYSLLGVQKKSQRNLKNWSDEQRRENELKIEMEEKGE